MARVRSRGSLRFAGDGGARARGGVRSPSGLSAVWGPPRETFCVALHGAKGGVGTTLLAAELAAAFSAAGLRTAAVDADFRRGSLHYRLDVPLEDYTFTLQDLLPVAADLSERVLDGALIKSPCGARLLPSRASPGAGADAGPRELKALLSVLLSSYERVVIDCGTVLEAWTPTLLGLSDMALLVMIPEVMCLGQAVGTFLALEKAGVSRGRIAVVVNRSLGEADSLSASEIRKRLGLDPLVVLPEEGEQCRRLSDRGEFFVHGRTPLARAIYSMLSTALPET